MAKPPTPVQIGLGAAVDTYLDAQAARAAVGALSPATVTNYRADLAHLVTVLGGHTITDDVTGADLDRALTAYAAARDARYRDPTSKTGPGRSAATQRRYTQSVNGFFTYAAKHAWVQVSPTEWATLTPQVRGALRAARTALTADQASALLAHGAGDPDPPGARPHERLHTRDRFLLATLMVLGPRVSELCAATDADWSRDGDAETWRIVGKGGAPRTLPLSPWLSGLKRDYLATRPNPATGLPAPVRAAGATATFRTGHGAPLTPRDVQRFLVRAHARVRAADPDHAREATPHALRHTAATLMLAAGWDVKVVAQMLGHASIATTGTYLDALPGELARAVADMTPC